MPQKSDNIFSLWLALNLDHQTPLYLATRSGTTWDTSCLASTLPSLHPNCPRIWPSWLDPGEFHYGAPETAAGVEDVEGAYAARLISMPDQLSGLELQDLSKALAKLPPWQREILMLVGANGVSYKEIAARQHVSVGTIKSWVNRARHHLANILGLGAEEAIGIRFRHH